MKNAGFGLGDISMAEIETREVSHRRGCGRSRRKGAIFHSDLDLKRQVPRRSCQRRIDPTNRTL